MADVGDSLDELRYQHHLQHRGRLNQRATQLFWLMIWSLVVARVVQRVWMWGLRRESRHNYVISRSCTSGIRLRVRRGRSLFRAIALTPLPRSVGHSGSFGCTAIVVTYTSIICALLLKVDAPAFSSHFVDDVAFRAAWVTLAQVPLAFFLSTKRGPFNLLTGVSYERINWAHRWIGRALFISATTHVAIMISSISIKDLMTSPTKAMSIVRCGVGAYGTLAWIALSSILPLRKWSHRLFHINHSVSTLVFLWILFNHVPSYARGPIYASCGLIAFDKCLTFYTFLWNNITIRLLKRRFSKFRKGPGRQILAMGHSVKMMTPFNTNLSIHPKESTTIIRICDLPFLWRPGQHVRIYLPKLGLLEAHPFTPATCSEVPLAPFSPYKDADGEHDVLLPQHSATPANDMVLMIRSHAGLTRRLAEYYARWLSFPCPNSSRPSSSLTAYIDGPYGSAKSWEDYETIVLVASSTGVSFILAILDYLEQICFDDRTQLHTRHIRFIWTNRHIEPQFERTVTDMLLCHSTILRESGVTVEADFYVTCARADEQGDTPEMRDYDPFAHLRRPRRNHFAGRAPLRIRNPNAPDDEEDEANFKEVSPVVSEIDSQFSFDSNRSTLIDEERPIISELESTLEELETSCWSRVPLIGSRRSSAKDVDVDLCRCALIQAQRQKCSTKSMPDFIRLSHGTRPDIVRIVSSSAGQVSAIRTMIAVCSNPGISAQAKKTVARLNFDFAMGRRDQDVEIHIEGFR